MYVLNFFGILAGRCGSVVVRERDKKRKVRVRGPGLTALGCDFLSFNRNAFSITGQMFSKCLTNGSDRLRKGQLPRRSVKWRVMYRMSDHTKYSAHTA